MDKVIENVKLVEIDKTKKYIISVEDSINIDEVIKIRDSIFQWLDEKENPMIILYGSGITLLEVEQDE